jgi:hypothetical protein
MSRDRDVITEQVLRMEKKAFTFRLFLAIGGYVGITLWLNAIRQTAVLWFGF